MHIYYSHNDIKSTWESINLPFNTHPLNLMMFLITTLLLDWSDSSWFSFFNTILFSSLVDRPLNFEVGHKNQSSAAELWYHWEATWEQDVICDWSSTLWISFYRAYSWFMVIYYQSKSFLSFSHLIEISRTNFFCKVGRM